MSVPRWEPPIETSPEEDALLKRLSRVRKLFGFLRRHRHEIFDDSLQDELAEMYRQSGAGKSPVPPAMLAMATLLQGYVGASDAEAVEMTVVDRRWQLVLGCLGADKPAFSQGALQGFRERLIEHDMDERLLERTVEVARETGGFDYKQVSKALRIAVDSAPFEGAGRVEDTFNLLGHAARNIVEIYAALTQDEAAKIAVNAGVELVNASSIKAGLDVDWTDEEAQLEALNHLVDQVESLRQWIATQPHGAHQTMAEPVATLDEIQRQDIEPNPDVTEAVQIRNGVAQERRISIEDAQMRHGRKSSSTRIDGYKRHVVRDLDTGLIRSCEVTPANRPEADALEVLVEDLCDQDTRVAELYIDRGYLSSPIVAEIEAEGGAVICRPWVAQNRGGRFTKDDFDIDLERMLLTCPGEHTVPIRRLSSTVKFSAKMCGNCPLRAQCTSCKPGRGRSVRIAADEPRQQQLQRFIKTSEGREQLRQRVPVEHSLAHLVSRQGRQARYMGVRKNLYDTRRACAIQNLETTQRSIGEGYYRSAA